MNEDALQWYLVQCKPREDDRALQNLERQSFECYRAVRRSERRYPTGRRYVATESLFRGYLFIRLDRKNDNWSLIHSTRGVNRIVRFNESPLPVPDAIIEGIRTRLAAGPQVQPLFEPGDRVQIIDGPFVQLEAIFLCNDGDERLVLLMNILNQEQRVRFSAGSVRRVV